MHARVIILGLSWLRSKLEECPQSDGFQDSRKALQHPDRSIGAELMRTLRGTANYVPHGADLACVAANGYTSLAIVNEAQTA